MKTVYIFLAEGFEEIEAITPIDLLRRAGVTVHTVGVTGKVITGSHGIAIQTDKDGENFILPQDADMVILPGGLPGSTNLAASDMISQVLKDAQKKEIYIAAICAAPKVLYKAGLLTDKKVTAYPSVHSELVGCTVTGTPVEIDGKIITGRSAGVAIQFTQALITSLVGEEVSRNIIESIYPC